jgi:DNA modification methylase
VDCNTQSSGSSVLNESFLNGRVILHAGDCLDVLATLAENSVDSVICDPPYHLTSIVKRFGSENSAPAKGNEAFVRASRGFMGKQWDGGDIAFQPDTWRAVMRVLKPGGHLVAFSGTRTYHRMAVAIEDAGFEIRDCLQWLYGSGFPKSHDVSKGIDKAAGAEREVMEFRKSQGGRTTAANPMDRDAGITNKFDPVTAPATDSAREWQGWGTALKPSVEKICLAQKPSGFTTLYDTIGSTIVALESRLWSMLSAKIAANNFGLSQSEFDAACASAQWNVEQKNNTRVALSEQMGMSRFVSALISSLNTVSSWKNTWAEGSAPENTFTTETVLSTTIDLRTLRFFQSKITPEDIIQAHATGLWSIAHASTAVRVFAAAVSKLNATLELSAVAPALSWGADSSLDAGVRPNLEPICLARKPLSEKTVAANVLRWGTGAINIDGCRVEGIMDGVWGSNQSGSAPGKNGTMGKGWDGETRTQAHTLGRWPANLLHDGSEEVLAGFPDLKAGVAVQRNGGGQKIGGDGIYRGSKGLTREDVGYGDSGSAARFFYTSKADASDRIGSKHPTVKPVDLMQWLVRLVTPKGGTCLDPFAGTGTTGEAAFREGFSAILIEREEEYQADISRRMALCLAGPDEKQRAIVKAKGLLDSAGPLFA